MTATVQVIGALSFVHFTELEHLHFVIYLEDFREEMGQSWTCSRMCADMLSTATRLRTLTTLILTIEVPVDIPAALIAVIVVLQLLELLLVPLLSFPVLLLGSIVLAHRAEDLHRPLGAASGLLELPP